MNKDDAPKLNSDRLMMHVMEKVRSDIERLFPTDATARDLSQKLLYHFAWNVSDKERKQPVAFCSGSAAMNPI